MFLIGLDDISDQIGLIHQLPRRLPEGSILFNLDVGVGDRSLRSFGRAVAEKDCVDFEICG